MFSIPSKCTHYLFNVVYCSFDGFRSEKSANISFRRVNVLITVFISYVVTVLGKFRIVLVFNPDSVLNCVL